MPIIFDFTKNAFSYACNATGPALDHIKYAFTAYVVPHATIASNFFINHSTNFIQEVSEANNSKKAFLLGSLAANFSLAIGGIIGAVKVKNYTTKLACLATSGLAISNMFFTSSIFKSACPVQEWPSTIFEY